MHNNVMGGTTMSVLVVLQVEESVPLVRSRISYLVLTMISMKRWNAISRGPDWGTARRPKPRNSTPDTYFG